MKRASGDHDSDQPPKRARAASKRAATKRAASGASSSRAAGSAGGLGDGLEGLGGGLDGLGPRRTYDEPESRIPSVHYYNDNTYPDQRWAMLRPSRLLPHCEIQLRDCILDGATSLCSRYGFVVKVRWESQRQALFICFEKRQTASQCCGEVNNMLYSDLVMLGAPAICDRNAGYRRDDTKAQQIPEHTRIIAIEIPHRDVPQGAELLAHNPPSDFVDCERIAQIIALKDGLDD